MYDVKKDRSYRMDGARFSALRDKSADFDCFSSEFSQEVRAHYRIRPGWSPGLVDNREGFYNTGSVGLYEEKWETKTETVQTDDGEDVELTDGSYRRRMLDIENPVLYVKDFGHGLYKVVKMLEEATGLGDKGQWKNETDESGRFLCNILRAKSMVEEYGLCNDFDWFATFTIDGEKLDRTDLETFRKRLVKMVRDFRHRRGVEIQYLLVPELHADGKSWHIHGLLKMPEGMLEEYRYSKKLPRRIKDKLLEGKRVFRWKNAESAYGWNTLEKIGNKEKSVRYLLKYFSKENRETAAALEKGQHLYFVSRGLEKAKKIPPDRWENIEPGAAPEFKRFNEWNIVEWWRVTETTSEESISG